ncbi:hypothetical protein A3A66_04835 [Microgenomates group bacterium RIFCSPLOWO2_01_FULL_46_13]|nr:MAG: hypothetical protein A2783_02330 [Microgenomates group bacterium RIFCSPHIGHO2_01_FULL_45_11]OGV94292.1 MAG: hypothetical protein A3A66_04835 [Microgenomates group bacterium RIFCSPLOWO2_01_FULL_46_13]
MSKALTIIFALIGLLYTLLLYWLGVAANENIVNELLRPTLIQWPLARTVFFLNRPGDSRYEYVETTSDTVTVEVDYYRLTPPAPEIEQWLKDLIQETVGKKVEVILEEDKKLPTREAFTDQELIRLSRLMRDYRAKDSTYLHVVYVPRSRSVPTNSGVVLTSREIFIFKEQINELSENVTVRKILEESTIKHEFGHLLGLEHVEDEDCVMAESVEVLSGWRPERLIPTKFCEESLRKINELRKYSDPESF